MKITALQSYCRTVKPEQYKQEAEIYFEEEFARIETLLQQGTKLLVTVEGLNVAIRPAVSDYHFTEYAEPLSGKWASRFSALAKAYDAYIVAGLITAQKDKLYNSAILFGPEGIVGIHNKVHLPAGEEVDITPGDTYQVYETPYGNIGMLVCWDMQFPEAARELALLGADVIVCPTLGCEKIYVPCRAYENSVTVVMAQGVPKSVPLVDFLEPSCIVDNMGNILASGTRMGKDAVTCEVDIKKEPAPQYDSEKITGHTSMRRTRLSQRRPDTYRQVVAQVPEVMKRYE